MTEFSSMDPLNQLIEFNIILGTYIYNVCFIEKWCSDPWRWNGNKVKGNKIKGNKVKGNKNSYLIIYIYI